MEDSVFERGYQLFQVQKFDAAIEYLQQALQQDPDHYGAKSLLVSCYIEKEDFARANTLNDSLLAIYPNDDELFYKRAIIAAASDKEALSKQSIDEAIRLNPYYSGYFGFKAHLHLISKDYALALGLANKGLELDPNDVFCLNIRAQALTKLNRTDEANDTIQNTLYQDPEGSFSHANVGWIALEQGNHKKALNHFKESLHNDPTNAYAQEGMQEAIKAKNFVYRTYLKYAFWMANKSSKSQWGFIIGLFIVYRILAKVLASSGNENLAYLVIVPYMLFVVGGWIMEPMSNMILRFHSYGKYLLSKNQKASGTIFFILLVLGTIASVLYGIYDNTLILLIAIAFFATIIPATRGILAESKWTRTISLVVVIYTLFMGFFGFLIVEDAFWIGASVPLGVVVYTWISGFLED
ncbi:tetratricopeptide repeat protein [Aquimarina brevivitae]|uniref:Tetratricopeptide repeat protein n=1 Tax=Aquimarina brevivitae TaxID=323412 RepID=A0A4Q7P3M4_9FLAO|nr:tetratricopeptide repeat protein [Aquimarina brevivitae]RZS93272.1 tetratricopeptide repeat protein [Aquimarina brevivitae]